MADDVFAPHEALGGTTAVLVVLIQLLHQTGKISDADVNGIFTKAIRDMQSDPGFGPRSAEFIRQQIAPAIIGRPAN